MDNRTGSFLWARGDLGGNMRRCEPQRQERTAEDGWDNGPGSFVVAEVYAGRRGGATATGRRGREGCFVVHRGGDAERLRQCGFVERDVRGGTRETNLSRSRFRFRCVLFIVR